MISISYKALILAQRSVFKSFLQSTDAVGGFNIGISTFCEGVA